MLMSFNDQINLFTNFSCLRILFLTFPHLVMETILILWLKLFFSRILKNWKKFLRHLSKFLLHCTKFTSTKLCIQIINKGFILILHEWFNSFMIISLTFLTIRKIKEILRTFITVSSSLSNHPLKNLYQKFYQQNCVRLTEDRINPPWMVQVIWWLLF